MTEYVTEATTLKMRQDRFIAMHHHLINPRFFTAGEIQMRNNVLAAARQRRYEFRTIKMGYAVLPDGTVVHPLPDGAEPYDSQLKHSMSSTEDARP